MPAEHQMRTLQPAVYILASQLRGTLYIGVTNNLISRVSEHRDGTVPGFTSRYDVKTLVYFEFHDTMELAITREKRLKKTSRLSKIKLIETTNPEWKDLWEEICSL